MLQKQLGFRVKLFWAQTSLFALRCAHLLVRADKRSALRNSDIAQFCCAFVSSAVWCFSYATEMPALLSWKPRWWHQCDHLQNVFFGGGGYERLFLPQFSSPDGGILQAPPAVRLRVQSYVVLPSLGQSISVSPHVISLRAGFGLRSALLWKARFPAITTSCNNK